ncbi:sensor histidine kinase [Spirosoma pollinicola]|uniref:histidine kinase n=1 Tax=Spirosoma pollinicola TaxID=2057025 RepID=A0A2K8Z560_9BACT|nr:ATP-binding protein [Spirosoma pollinicola]AUD04988.1 hypothetical protein CWM47_25955 [Spirosoma pollinicola]
MKKSLFKKGEIWNLFGFDGLDAEEFKKRTTAVQLAIFTAASGVVYALIYVFLGFPSVAYVIYIYIPICLLNLIYLRISHRYDVFGVVQLALIFLFPLVTQLTIGGFVEASAVVFAVFLAPAGALLYTRRSVARISFYLFVIVIIAAAVWEYQYGRQEPVLPRGVILTFFASNLVTICGIVYFLLESFLQKQEELRAELRQSLDTLRTTQDQLIQAEKMASLGELTAGIAHEIQNPLNFVKNFSEVSIELIQELSDEHAKGDQRDQVLEADLMADLSHNMSKISHHGNRASSIVRGMLEHSRQSSGQTVPTDLNALCNEYIGLAYHGLRAKDKSFNVDLVKDLAPDLGLVNLISQDVGRVLLNLCTNAFYAVHQRQKVMGELYKPRVQISTRRINNKITIQLIDNGTGIPADIRQKIFQPFFTTKPPGQGTGLGLSLAYDIITKGHGGTLTAESVEDKGTTFTITLPA